MKRLSTISIAANDDKMSLMIFFGKPDEKVQIIDTKRSAKKIAGMYARLNSLLLCYQWPIHQQLPSNLISMSTADNFCDGANVRRHQLFADNQQSHRSVAISMHAASVSMQALFSHYSKSTFSEQMCISKLVRGVRLNRFFVVIPITENNVVSCCVPSEA